MTALEKYVRLEAIGLWRERPEAPPREVVVSFGNSTLVLKDLADRPLGHWALAGVSVVGYDFPATIYAMTADGGETLAIRDPEMVAAIAAVSRPRLGPVVPPPPPRRRWPLLPLLLLAAAAALVAAAPRLIRAEASRLVPPERAAELGDRMLIALIERQGPLCYDPAGQQALAHLAARLDPADPPRLRVIELGDAPAALLPGRTVLIDRDLPVAAAPEEIAGWAALALGREPVAALLAGAGPAADLRYLVTGDFTEQALARAAEAAIVPPQASEIPPAFSRLAAAGFDPRPFDAALGRAGLPQANPAPPDPPAQPLADQDWVALQGICG
jgi:hypothetical protein